MGTFSPEMRSELHEAGVNPEFAAALNLRERDDALLIPYGRHRREIARVGWEPGLNREVEDWPLAGQPAAWWPVGRGSASTVVVTAGAGNALSLACCTHGVDAAGNVRRKANLPGLLHDLVPVALPVSVGGLPLEWTIKPDRGVEELFTEIVGPELDVVFLSFPETPPELQPATPGRGPSLDLFTETYCERGRSIAVTPAVAPLPCATTWREVLAPFTGAARTAALAGVLEYWHRAAFAPQPTKGVPQ